MAKAFAKKIYNSPQWKACRDAYATYRHHQCERCGQPGEEVHHKTYLTPVNINDPEIVYGWDNLELLCRSCHIEEHEKKKNLRHENRKPVENVRYTIDASGQVQPRGKVCVVWGCPASGKSTYIRQHMQRGDIVIDLDRILYCFTGLVNLADDADAITEYLPDMITIRDATFDLIARDALHACTIWIAAGLPRKADRQQVTARFPFAQFVFCDCAADEAMRRADQDDKRTNKERAHKIIAEWFERFEP